MEQFSGAPAVTDATEAVEPASTRPADIVSTHVLVEEGQVDRLRELSRRTRIAQSEYLREAVDDLLGKYSDGSGGARR